MSSSAGRNLLFVVCFGACWVVDHGSCRDNYTQPAIPVAYTPYQSELVLTVPGNSSKFDPKGMQPLYIITNMFMDLVGGSLKRDIPPDLLPAEDGNIGNVYSYAKQWMSYEKGVVVCAGIGLGLAVLVPFLGLIFCCCRCCGKCGANPEKFDKRSDPCQCGTLTALFVLLCLVITFGVVCAFVTNEYMKTNVRKVDSTWQESVDNVQAYLQDSQKHASHVLKVNFKELEDHIKETLNDTEVTSEMMFDSGVAVVGAENLFSFAERLARADEDILNLNKSFARLKVLEETLRNNVTSIRDWMAQIATECRSRYGSGIGTPCDEIIGARDNLAGALTVNFQDLSLSNPLADFEKTISPSVVAQIREGRAKLRSVKSMLKNELRTASSAVMEKLEEARTTVLNTEFEIRKLANTAQLEVARLDITPYLGYVEKYNLYIWYAKLVLCVMVLLILATWILATLFGMCGIRSGSLYEDPFCSKSKGSCLMICGVGLVCIFYSIVMVAVTALFIVGINVQLLGCDSIQNPTANNHLRVLSVILEQNGMTDDKLRDLAGKLQKCHDNQGIYAVLDLNSTFNVQSTMEKRLENLNVLPTVARIVKDATDRIRETKFMTPAEKGALMILANSTWISTINLDSTIQTLSGKDRLRGSVDAIINGTYRLEPLLQENTRSVSNILRVRRELENLKNTVLAEMEKEKSDSLEMVNELSNLLVQGNPARAILQFVNDAEKAEARFQEFSEPIIRATANDTLDNLQRYVSQYLNYSLQEVESNVGRCRPVSAAINTTINFVCKDVLYPFNGFWVSLGTCLVLFLPSVLIAIALAWHYRVPESYRSSSSDSDFEPQIIETDTIPLAHRQSVYAIGFTKSAAKLARKRVHPSSLDNSAYDSRARQSKATQWAFHNAFKHQNDYYPVRKASHGPTAPVGSDDAIYTRPPSYYYPGSNS